jgi:hypothetical protein
MPTFTLTKKPFSKSSEKTFRHAIKLKDYKHNLSTCNIIDHPQRPSLEYFFLRHSKNENHVG